MPISGISCWTFRLSVRRWAEGACGLEWSDRSSSFTPVPQSRISIPERDKPGGIEVEESGDGLSTRSIVAVSGVMSLAPLPRSFSDVLPSLEALAAIYFPEAAFSHSAAEARRLDMALINSGICCCRLNCSSAQSERFHSSR